MTEDIHVLNCGDYWTVCNKVNGAGQENHSHFWFKKAAYTFKLLVEEKVIPRSMYMVESALRVSMDEEYKRCIRDKYDIPHDVDIFNTDVKPIIQNTRDKCSKK